MTVDRVGRSSGAFETAIGGDQSIFFRKGVEAFHHERGGA
jgi:hypothetical protein